MTQSELTKHNRRRVFEYIRANPNCKIDDIIEGLDDYSRCGVLECLRWHLSPENEHVEKMPARIKKGKLECRIFVYKALVGDYDDALNKHFEIKHKVSKSEFQSLPSFMQAIVQLEGV